MCPTIYRGRRRMEEENQKLLRQKKKKTRRLKKRRQHGDIQRNVEIGSGMVCKPLKLRRRGNSAPQNTTQFLMEDKMEMFPEYVISPSRSNSPFSSPSSPSVSSSPLGIALVSESQEGTCEDGQFMDDFDDEYFQKDFEETYERIRGESLMAMSHAELLTQYLQLEMKEEELKKKVKQLSECSCNSPFNVIVNVSCANCGTCATVKSEPRFAVAEQNFDLQQTAEKDISDEIEELRRKNCALKEENTKLKCIAATESRSC